MARTIAVIQTEIKAKVRTFTSLDGFKFPEDSPAGSSTGVFNLLIFIVAASIYTFEVLIDILREDIQEIADSAPSGNLKWIQDQMFKFQYGDVVVLTDFVPGYDPVVEANRIITQCSVREVGNSVVAIKVAKGTSAPFTPLTAPELSALTDYYYGTASTEGVGFAGVKAGFISLDPDRLYVEADIYYLGQYVEATVKAAVIAAIDAFLQSFADEAFDGSLYMIRLVDAIQAVAGVDRVVLNDIRSRAASVAFASASTVDIQGVYNTIAGHIISEDTVGETLNDKLTMIQA